MNSRARRSPSRRLLGYFRPHRRRLVLGLLAIVIANVCAMGMIWLVRDVIRPIAPPSPHPADREALPAAPLANAPPRFTPAPTAPVPMAERSWLLVLACLKILGLGIARALFAFVGFYFVTYTSLHVVRELRNRMYAHLQRLSISFFDRERTGHLMSRIISDTALVQNILTGEVFNMVATPVAAVVGVAMMLALNWKLTLISMVVFPLAGLAMTKAGRKIRTLTSGTQSKIAELSSVLQEAVTSIRTVKSLGTESFEVARFAARSDETTRFGLHSARVEALLRPMVELVAVFGFVAAFWFGGGEVIRGRMDAADLVTFALLIQRLGTEASRLGRVNLVFQQMSAATERIFNLLSIQPEVVDRKDALPLEVLQGRVTFEDVSFSYNPQEPVLDKISFTLSPGERLALVGSSGAGKTTVANLVLRLYESDCGAVTVDGHDVRDITMDSLRQAVALVPQEPALFTGTIAENIAYGRFDAPREEIVAAAKAANAHDFISAFPEGYDTPVGERGVSLSGGQRQRIAIARAILRDPRILVLDEATSSLDAESEAAVQQGLENLMRGRTTLVIAHRLSTVRNADRILVLDRGRIGESGSHASLMALDGVYRRLYTLQERGYRYE